MRILAFDKSGQPTLGVRRGDDVVDLSIAAPDLPDDMPTLIAAGDDAMACHDGWCFAANSAGFPHSLDAPRAS